MKQLMPQRPLRFATARAYDASLRGPGSFWVERSAEEFALDEPISGSHGQERAAEAGADSVEDTAERPFIHTETGAVCTNPLRDEPSPVAVGAVKRFGLVGLVTVAVGAGIARWWNSLSQRNH
jgi:hypothetical protein